MAKQEKLILSISIVAVVMAVIILIYMPSIIKLLTPKPKNFIGIVTKSSGSVRIRYGNTMNWQDSKVGDHVYMNSYLFTGVNAISEYTLIDKTKLVLKPSSLLLLDYNIDEKVEKKKKSLKIDVVDGNVIMDIKKNSIVRSVGIDKTEVIISKNETQLNVSNGEEGQGAESQISVTKGEVGIKSEDGTVTGLEKGQQASVKEGKSIKKDKIPDSIMYEMSKAIGQSDSDYAKELRYRRSLQFYTDGIKNFFINLFSEDY